MAAMAALAGLSLAGSYSDSVALSEQAKNEELNARLDADVLKTNAKLKTKAAEEEVQNFSKKVAKFKGEQRAALAESGVSVDYGSAADVQAETALMAAEDIERIRNNATLEAFGLRSKASMLELQGKANAQSLRNQASGTLLGGVVKSAALAYSGYSKMKAPSPKVPTDRVQTISGQPYRNTDEDIA